MVSLKSSCLKICFVLLFFCSLDQLILIGSWCTLFYQDYFVEKVTFSVPHPINFALHKLIIFQRRRNKDKALKDKESALRILRALINKGETQLIKDKLKNIPKGWQKKYLLVSKFREKKICLMCCVIR
ncbi:MAG: hypothetical protein HQM16_19260 [Deltaproteobacteria bacterium]|nr:hypothetical protein [Deltaproteobacteria bacterium]